jgi:serine/threonine protein phosphatase PrpC
LRDNAFRAELKNQRTRTETKIEKDSATIKVLQENVDALKKSVKAIDDELASNNDFLNKVSRCNMSTTLIAAILLVDSSR